jgi:hypothetical protein
VGGGADGPARRSVAPEHDAPQRTTEETAQCASEGAAAMGVIDPPSAWNNAAVSA